MPFRAAIPVRWRRWVAAWVIVLLALVWGLSPAPHAQVEVGGQVVFRGFVDDRTLVAEHLAKPADDDLLIFVTGPIEVLDLSNGTLRTIHLPDDSLAGRTTITRREIAANRGWRFEWMRLAKDSLVVGMGAPPSETVPGQARGTGPKGRLLVFDVRTGTERFRREFTNATAGVLGERVWIQSTEKAPEPFLTLLDLRTGAEVPTAIPPGRVNWSTCVAEPNGTFLVERLKTRVRVWRVDAAEPVWETDADVHAVSPDARRLAMLTSGPVADGKPEQERWRIYDLEKGRLLAEQRQDVEGHRPPVERLAFLEGDRHVAAYTASPPFPKNSRAMPVIRGVDVWDWREERLRSMRSATGEVYQTDPAAMAMDGATALRLIVDGEDLIDVATGERVHRVPLELNLQEIDPTYRWAVVQDPSPAPPRWVLRLAARISSWLTNAIVPESNRSLYDLSAQRRMARLPPGWEMGVFSPDGKWFVSQRGGRIDLWSLPTTRPWGRTALISLLIPIVALFVGMQKSGSRARALAAGGASGQGTVQPKPTDLSKEDSPQPDSRSSSATG